MTWTRAAVSPGKGSHSKTGDASHPANRSRASRREVSRARWRVRVLEVTYAAGVAEAGG